MTTLVLMRTLLPDSPPPPPPSTDPYLACRAFLRAQSWNVGIQQLPTATPAESRKLKEASTSLGEMRL